MTAETHIFFSQVEVEAWLADNDQWIEAYCALYEERVAKLQEPDHSAFHLWHFMPPPCYEEKIGLHIEAGETYSPGFGASNCCLWVLQLTDPDTRAALHVGDTVIEIRATDKALQCFLGDQQVTLEGREVKLSYQHRDGQTHVAADGYTLARLPGPGNTGSTKASLLNVISGEVALIQCQSLGPRPGFVSFDIQSSSRHRKIEAPRNPYRFEWGLRGIQINSLLLMAATLSDIAKAAGTAPKMRDELRSRVSGALDQSAPIWRRLLEAWLLWPRWRAGAGPWPESGPWDRNAFNNGITASSVALAWRLLGAEIPKADILNAVSLKASSFFDAQNGLAFLPSSKGRNATWWIKRSANHGLIMMLSYLTAMRLTGQEDAPTAQLVHGNAMRALQTLYSDGSFCEGLHYHNFCFAQYLPYRQLLEGSLPGDVAAFEALLPAVRDWVALCQDDRGAIFANFGDNVSRARSPDRLSIAQYLDRCAGPGLIQASDPARDTSMDTFVPFSLPRPDLPAPTAPAATGLVARAYDRNQYAHAVSLDARGQRHSGLFVIGSRRQLTHNHNHDCTGFAFFCPELDITISQAKAQPHQNNAVGLLQPNGRLARFDGRRDYNGKVRHCDSEARDYALFEATMDAKVRLGIKQTRALKIARHFLFTPEAPDILAVQTELTGALNYRPFLAFNAHWRSKTPSLKLLSWMQDDAGDWALLSPEIKKTQTRFIVPASKPQSEQKSTRFLTAITASPSPNPKEISQKISALLTAKDPPQP